MPVEGGARLAIIESAQRMNEDAQAALLKTLEEPPAGAVLILCADGEEPLLPTIRSRCARLRLGPVGPRAIEAVLADHGIDDPALATRLARVAGGRPGVALAWAADPTALRARDECSRVLLDLTAARPADRLAGVRSTVVAASAFAATADPTTPPPVAVAATGGRGKRGGKTAAPGGAGAAALPGPGDSPTTEDRGTATDAGAAAGDAPAAGGTAAEADEGTDALGPVRAP